ncbi:Efflux ABC transporter, ATP-binding protein [Saccharolobus shibatae B12]|uniref:Efflux ABC transporter, ATP-binding protein n=1 Tax=Saccharolobus shibatae (strain ATCC 51178 / DSM 5389 / JCM 8931 / NBRC 15437 / B12) TaxID=523848 RepID=A0A8F5BLJ7_SACSH|nr:ATP-binding cassette domain-containing protein [Saccharolobus shibatae]QXJ27544.1 Efflux ABC transporter, ATP-binding protein [Saccharolobus shibatae B12]
MFFNNFAVYVKDMIKTYNGKVKALNGIDLEVEWGTAFALLGPNGAGKTTLIRILTTQIPPSGGSAYVGGYNVTDDANKVRKIIGYVPQEISVWTDLTAYDNLLIYSKIYGIPSSERKEKIEYILDRLGLYEVRKDLVKTFSGGMIRRLEIACALLTMPKILFLDEPTIGLDPVARKTVWEELRKFKEEHDMTIFFTTHYMDEADIYSDKIALIDKGKVVKIGTSEELKRSIGNVIISFEVEDTNSEILNKIRYIPSIEDVIVKNNQVSVIVKDIDTVLPNLIDFIRTNGVKYKRIEIREITLDDVFIKYVGSSIEVRGRTSEVRQTRSRIRGA